MNEMSATLLTLIGFGITIAIFLIKFWNSNKQFNVEQAAIADKFRIDQEKQYIQFTTTTNLRLAALEKELVSMRDSILINRNDILNAYEKYKEETVRHTVEFRKETKEALSDNKTEHTDLKNTLDKMKENLDFIRGKLSSRKEKEENHS